MHLYTASFDIDIGYRLLCGCEKIVLKEVYQVAMLQWVTVCVYLDLKNVYLRDATDQSLSQTRIAANTQRGMRAVWTLNQFCVEDYALTQRSYANVAIWSICMDLVHFELEKVKKLFVLKFPFFCLNHLQTQYL